MPLVTDWDEFTDGVTTSNIDHYTVSPINGNRSVRLGQDNDVGAGRNGRAAIMLKEPPHNRDFVLGVVRTLVKPATTPRRFGIFCMAQSGTNPALTGSSSYILAQGSFSTAHFYLAKVTGFSDSSPTELLNTGISELTLGQIIPMQLTWRASLTIFGGVYLEASFGNVGDTDFTNLTSVGTAVDIASPLTASNGEGLFASNLDQLQPQDIIFDDTTVFETVIV